MHYLEWSNIYLKYVFRSTVDNGIVLNMQKAVCNMMMTSSTDIIDSNVGNKFRRCVCWIILSYLTAGKQEGTAHWSHIRS